MRPLDDRKRGLSGKVNSVKKKLVAANAKAMYAHTFQSLACDYQKYVQMTTLKNANIMKMTRPMNDYSRFGMISIA